MLFNPIKVFDMNNPYFLSNYRYVWALLLAIISCSVLAEDGDGSESVVKYIEMKPSFVVNYGEPSAKLRYAKIDVSLRVNSNSAAVAVEQHMPALRNEMVFLLSKQTDEVMGNTSGREQLRTEALKALQDYLNEEVGQSAIADLLFTSFVVQS